MPGLRATGVATTAADISLVSTAGPITLLQAVSTATPNIGTVRINSVGRSRKPSAARA